MTAHFYHVHVLWVVRVMASVVLVSFVSQTRGIKFYDLRTSGAVIGEHVFLVRRPDHRYDAYCLDVRLVSGGLMIGHLEAPVASQLSPLMRDTPVDVSG